MFFFIITVIGAFVLLIVVMGCGIGSIVCCVKEMKKTKDNSREQVGFLVGNVNIDSGSSSPHLGITKK